MLRWLWDAGLGLSIVSASSQALQMTALPSPVTLHAGRSRDRNQMDGEEIRSCEWRVSDWLVLWSPPRETKDGDDQFALVQKITHCLNKGANIQSTQYTSVQLHALLLVRLLDVYAVVTQDGFIIRLIQPHRTIGHQSHDINSICSCNRRWGSGRLVLGEPLTLQDLIATGNVVHFNCWSWPDAADSNHPHTLLRRPTLPRPLVNRHSSAHLGFARSERRVGSGEQCDDVFSGPNTNIPHTQPASQPRSTPSVWRLLGVTV